MNFLGGNAESDGVAVPGLKQAVQTDVALPQAGEAMTVGLRPEHVEIDLEGDTHQVELTEALGGVSYAYLTCDTGEKMIIEERGDTRSSPGDRVGLRFDRRRVYFFGQDGARLR